MWCKDIFKDNVLIALWSDEHIVLCHKPWLFLQLMSSTSYPPSAHSHFILQYHKTNPVSPLDGQWHIVMHTKNGLKRRSYGNPISFLHKPLILRNCSLYFQHSWSGNSFESFSIRAFLDSLTSIHCIKCSLCTAYGEDQSVLSNNCT